MTLAARSRRMLDWHEHPGLIAWATTPLGRIAVWAAASLLLAPRLGPLAPLVLPLLALAMAFPAWRIDLLALGALGVAYRFVPRGARAGPLFVLAGMLLMLAMVALVFRAARDFRRLPRWVQRHPFLILHAALYGSLALSYLLPVADGTFLCRSGGDLSNRRAVPGLAIVLCDSLGKTGLRVAEPISRSRLLLPADLGRVEHADRQRVRLLPANARGRAGGNRRGAVGRSEAHRVGLDLERAPNAW